VGDLGGMFSCYGLYSSDLQPFRQAFYLPFFTKKEVVVFIEIIENIVIIKSKEC
jgi:hypothetical protein